MLIAAAVDVWGVVGLASLDVLPRGRLVGLLVLALTTLRPLRQEVKKGKGKSDCF